MSNGKLKEQVQALQLSMEGLLRLHTHDKEKFLEIVLGITTPREFELVSQNLHTMTQLVKHVETSARGIMAAGAAGKSASAD
jgi:hypothetical protein